MKTTILKIILLSVLLYLFFYSIILLGEAFKYFGSDFAKKLISATNNPGIGLFMGILATSIIQSSSTTTSIVVALVGGVEALPLVNAIPIVMGANIGTSITNILISFGHVTRKVEFRRATAAAVVHDFFNVLSVAVIFPIQYYTNFLGKSAEFIAAIFEGMGGLKFASPIKIIVNPLVTLTKYIIALTRGITLTDMTHARDVTSGIIMMIIAFISIIIVLRYLSKTIKTLVVHKTEIFFNQYIFRTYLISMIFGMILTAIVQSSSITTSLIIPLAGAGILTLHQIYPYTLGANIGTTITAMLASFSTGNITSVTIAFSHLLFNIFGISIFTPLKSLPILLAEKYSALVEKNRIIPIIFILTIFFVIPILFIYILL